MDTSRSDSPIHDRQPALSQPVKPYSQNWRERRQKARVIAEAYKRRKAEPVWDSPF